MLRDIYQISSTILVTWKLLLASLDDAIRFLTTTKAADLPQSQLTYLVNWINTMAKGHSLDTNIQLWKLLSCPLEAFNTELWTWCLLQARASTRRSYYSTIGRNVIFFCCIHSLDTNTGYLSCATSSLSPAASIATAHCVPKINWIFITVFVSKLC